MSLSLLTLDKFFYTMYIFFLSTCLSNLLGIDNYVRRSSNIVFAYSLHVYIWFVFVRVPGHLYTCFWVILLQFAPIVFNIIKNMQHSRNQYNVHML